MASEFNFAVCPDASTSNFKFEVRFHIIVVVVVNRTPTRRARWVGRPYSPPNQAPLPMVCHSPSPTRVRPRLRVWQIHDGGGGGGGDETP